MKKKILIIDDSPTLRKVLEFYLKKNEYLVETANNGKVGLAAINNENFDLIILDMQMPVMSGKDVLLAMKDIKVETPIMILSAEKDKDMIQMGLELGALFYLTKPFKPNKIVEKIKDIFEKIDKVKQTKF